VTDGLFPITNTALYPVRCRNDTLIFDIKNTFFKSTAGQCGDELVFCQFAHFHHPATLFASLPTPPSTAVAMPDTMYCTISSNARIHRQHRNIQLNLYFSFCNTININILINNYSHHISQSLYHCYRYRLTFNSRNIKFILQRKFTSLNL
jgi:hypothetical protein